MEPENEGDWRVLEQDDDCLRDMLLDALTRATDRGGQAGLVAHLRRRGDEAVVVLTSLDDDDEITLDEDPDELDEADRFSRLVVRHAR